MSQTTLGTHENVTLIVLAFWPGFLYPSAQRDEAPGVSQLEAWATKKVPQTIQGSGEMISDSRQASSKTRLGFPFSTIHTTFNNNNSTRGQP